MTHMLEENRDLLNDMTNRECSQEGAAQLPKILFDLMSQANECEVTPMPEVNTDEPNAPSTSAAVAADIRSEVTSAQEIINNLPKVWKVLIELLNHQKMTPVPFKVDFRFHFPFKNICFSLFVIIKIRRTMPAKIATNRCKHQPVLRWS